jgi:hypothetical protein
MKYDTLKGKYILPHEFLILSKQEQNFCSDAVYHHEDNEKDVFSFRLDEKRYHLLCGDEDEVIDMRDWSFTDFNRVAQDTPYENAHNIFEAKGQHQAYQYFAIKHFLMGLD